MRIFPQKSKTTQPTTSAKSTILSPARFGQGHDTHSMFKLPHTIGNQAVLRLLQTATENIDACSAISTSYEFSHDFSRIPFYPGTRNSIQPKLQINAPRDRYEQEADRIADEVLRQKMPEEQDETVDIQARPSLPAAGGERDISEHLENRLNRSRSSGSPLSRATQSYFEPRMRYDFSNAFPFFDATFFDIFYMTDINSHS